MSSKFNIIKGTGNSTLVILWGKFGNPVRKISLAIFLFHSILQILLDKMLGYIIIWKNILIIWSFRFGSLSSFPTIYDIENNWSYSCNLYIPWIHDIIAKIHSLMETLICLLFPIFSDLILYNQFELFQTLSPLNKFLVSLREIPVSSRAI